MKRIILSVIALTAMLLQSGGATPINSIEKREAFESTDGGHIAAATVHAATTPPDRQVTFKTPDIGAELSLHIYDPQRDSNKPLPCIVFFFGGGWMGGSPRQFYQQAEYFRRRGIVAISADYRTKKSHQVMPEACVRDGKSAIRWVRANAKALNIDPNRIIAAGGSAGGHVAGCTGVLAGFEDEPTAVSSKPNAMVLFNPVLDTTDKGYGAKAVGPNKTVLSPCHQVKKGIPPTIVFHGTKDTTVPFENAARFTKLMKDNGNTCELVPFKDRGHGFFNGLWFRKRNGDDDFAKCVHEADRFLTKQGMLDGDALPLEAAYSASWQATLPAQTQQIIACVGDSNTQRGYPKILQQKLGAEWKAINCGISAATILDGTLRPFHKMEQYNTALGSKANVIIIMLGTNDANPRWWDAERKTAFDGPPAAEFKAGYLKLIKDLQVMDSKPQLLLAIPLPVFPTRAKPANQENTEGRRANLVNKVIPLIREVAAETKLPLVDIHGYLSDSVSLSTDGVHFNNAGDVKMCEALAAAVKKLKQQEAPLP